MSLLIPEQFLAVAANRPDAPAVRQGGSIMTYRELERAARRIAGALADRGARPETVVGVLVTPGPDLVATLIGIWLAGGCYLPLDRHAPAERLRRILDVAGATLVVCDDGPRAGLSTNMIVDLPGPIAGDVLWHPADGFAAHRAAYVMFTSGSTGTPKGVVIEHAGIANRIRWAVKALELTAEDRILQKTPLTFDAAGWEIFAPLTYGGAVTFGSTGAGQDAAELARSTVESGATILQVVPTMLRQLAAEPELAACKTLRIICSAGEPLQAELCTRVRELVDVDIWNTYGPTECSIDVLAARFDPAQRTGPVPIGHPIDGARYHLEPVPDEPDLFELYAGGIGVGRGYLGDPAATADRFVPDEVGPPGARLYRTGDLVRCRHDGALEFAGRRDDQVKINGIRIEPGEVEAALVTHPDVTEAAVRAVTDPYGIPRLAAWVVVSSKDVASGLPAYLREKLPSALVPAVFTEVAVLPRTTSGKTDRAALPEPDWATPPTAPSTRDDVFLTVEQRIVLDAWREVLDLQEIGLDDDFVRLGGHSLMTTRLAARLERVTRLALDFRELHFATTPRAQAELIREAVAADPVPRLAPDARLPLSPAQERFWVLDRMDARSREYLLPVHLWIPAEIAPQTVSAALTELVARHDVLRSRYVMDIRGLCAVIEPDVPVTLRTIDVDANELPAALATLVSDGFDLGTTPLFRAALIRDGGTEQLLVLVCHHIIGDGWSTALLARDLRILLGLSPGEQLGSGAPRYVDAVAWQLAQLTDEVRSAELDYWRHQLAGLPPLDLLPTTFRRDTHRRIDGGIVRIGIAPDVAASLRKVGRQSGATPYVSLLTVWTVLLSRLSGQWDFGVGTPHAGRSRPDLHTIVGPFINTLVIRSRLAPEMTFSQALAQVSRVCRDGFSRHRLPFEQVLEAAAPVRDTSRTPLFQSFFTVIGEGDVGLPLSDRDLDLFARVWSVARTDVALTVWPGQDGSYGGFLEYASALFDPEAGADLARRLATLTARLAADPTTAIGADGLDEPTLAVMPEQAVLDHVRELLGQPGIGPFDDVIEAGGTSLIVSRLLWYVQETFDVEVPMRAFFDRPTAADLARAVTEGTRR
ncbi:non-ribosomal peptide synthetase [Micromonospora sp. CNB394]|uniref:non-ribosomal peptide synthetase n=1 Tax=Micromonospora sp. CNB394 TaxID=1169151 RepID=UPI0003A88113|nr:non-ribosomal peptide synthetase [Micromonospora sp. CNB394]